MKKAVFSNSKHSEHSKKNCVCGGHSKHDVKKNKHHNSTMKKLSIKEIRKMKYEENILLRHEH